MLKIGIIGAMDNEIEKFIEMFDLKVIDDKHMIYNCIYGNKELFIVKSGIGKVNSSAKVQYLINKYNIDLIINSGCAGSLTSNIKVMDVIISKYVTYHDFKPLRIMEYSTPNKGMIYADKDLVDKLELVLKKLSITNYHKAIIASGDHFVTDAIKRDKIHIETKAEVVDMESASIGHIATINDVPFVILRTISDFADGVDNFEEKAAHNSSTIIRELLNII
jgi:adenosylhomocysteine nucleosidase